MAGWRLQRTTTIKPGTLEDSSATDVTEPSDSLETTPLDSDNLPTTETGSKRMTLYICGPMRGYDDYNFPAFFKAEKALRAMGHVTVNPARHDKESGFDETTGEVTQQYLRDAMAWDLGQVCRADGVVVLSGWHKSYGARAEVAAARAVGLPVYIIVQRIGEPTTLREARHI